jgi:hypothetical protein
MYHVSSRKRTASIKIQLESDDLTEFGNYGVVVKNTGEFIDHINRSLPGFSFGLIDYINFNNLTEKDRFASSIRTNSSMIKSSGVTSRSPFGYC